MFKPMINFLIVNLFSWIMFNCLAYQHMFTHDHGFIFFTLFIYVVGFTLHVHGTCRTVGFIYAYKKEN